MTKKPWGFAKRAARECVPNVRLFYREAWRAVKSARHTFWRLRPLNTNKGIAVGSTKTPDKIRNSSRSGLVIIAIILGIGFLFFGFTSANSSSRPGDILVGGCFLAFGVYELYKFVRK